MVLDNQLGRLYQDGEDIIRQGDPGDCMYVIQKGRANVIVHRDGADVLVGTAGEGEIVGEMSLIEKEARCATVRACGEVRVLTIDKATFLRRVHEDPAIAFQVARILSHRIRDLTQQVARLMERT